MSDKEPTQAMTTDHHPDRAPIENQPEKWGGSESDGGAYPNPHTGHGEDKGGFLGHGGQSEIDYSGTGEGAGDDDPQVGNVNAVTGKD